MPWARQVARIVGKRRSHFAAPNSRASSHTCSAPVSRIRRMIALATTSRGARSASSCCPCMNRTPASSTQERALAAHRLGDQRLLARGPGAEPHHRRVELHELQVAQHRAGAQRERHPVAGGDRRVGGRGEHLAEPAAGQHHGAAQHRADAVALALAHHVQGDAGDAAVRAGDQVEHERVLGDVDVGGGVHRGDQGPLDLRAGGVAAGVRDPVAEVAALAGQRQLAGLGVVEDRAQRDQLADRVRPLGHQHPDRLLVADAGAGDERVVQVLVGGVAGTECGGDPALGPLGRARGEEVLGDHHDRADRGEARSWSAAVSPAMPEPITTTSA